MTVRLSIRKRDGWVWIRVIDNGCGMEKERLEQVRSQIKEGRKTQGKKRREVRELDFIVHRCVFVFTLELRMPCPYTAKRAWERWSL